MDDALRDGVRLAVVSGTMSSPEDGIVDAAMAKLGTERAAKVRVFSINLDAPAAGEEGEDGDAPPAFTFEQSIQLVQAKARRPPHILPFASICGGLAWKALVGSFPLLVWVFRSPAFFPETEMRIVDKRSCKGIRTGRASLALSKSEHNGGGLH